MPADELTSTPGRPRLKPFIAANWVELTLAPAALITALIYQGAIFFWLGVSLLCLIGWLIARSIMPVPGAAITVAPITLAIGALWLWCATTILWSVVPLASSNLSLALLVLPLGFVIYALAVRGDAPRRAVLIAVLLLLGLGLAVMSFNEARLGLTYPRSLFLNKNTHAGFLNLVILPAAAAFMLVRRPALVVALGFLLAVLGYSAGLPASRGALLALLVGTGILAGVSWRSDRRARLVAAVLIIGIAYAAAGIAAGLGTRLGELPVVASSGSDRWYIWEGALRLLTHAPWYGEGLGTFGFIYPAYRHPLDASAGTNAHNDYLQLLIEAGVPGLVLLVALILAVVWLGRRMLADPMLTARNRVEIGALLGGLAAVGTHSLVSFNLYHPSFLLVTALYLGRLQELAGEGWRIWSLTPRRRLTTGAAGVVAALAIGGLTVASAITVLAFEAYNEGDLDRAASLVSRLPGWLPFDDRIPYLEASLVLGRHQGGEASDDQSASAAFGLILGRLSRAEQLNPLRPSIPYLRARARLALGPPADSDAVLVDFNKALTLRPRYFEARLRYAETLIALGRVQEAHGLLVEGLKFAYSPYQGLADYYRFTEAVCTELGDEQNAERARAGLARYERLLGRLRKQRGQWGLASP